METVRHGIVSRRSSVASRWVLLAPALVGALALAVVTRGGAHASPDSAFYVGLARNLAGGVGWESPPGSFPLSHFPPLFPAVLAVFGWLGVDPLDAAGWLNPVLFGASAALVALVVHRATGSVAVGAGAAVSLVVSRDLLFAHSSALSEPLFIFLTLAAMVCLGRHLGSGSLGWLVSAAGLAGAATLTRYAGIVLVAVGVVAILAGARPLRRVGLAAGFAAVSLLPTLVWLTFAGSGDRPFGWHPFGLDYLLVTGRSLSAWILPRSLPWPARGVSALAAVTLVAVLLTRARARSGHVESHPPTSGQSADDVANPSGVGGDPLVFLCGLFAVAYVGILAVQNVLLDASSTLDYRLLAPLHTVAIVGGAIVFAPRLTNLALPGNLTWDRLAWVGRLVVVVLVAAQAVGAVAWVAGGVTDDSRERRGLTATGWEESAVMAAVEAMPAGIVVYSNAPDAIHMLTGRRAVALLPPSVDYLSGRSRLDFEPEMAGVGEAVERGSAVVAWFGAAPWRRSLYPPESAVVSALGLDPSPVLEDEVGRLYRTPSRTGVDFAPGSVQE